MLRVPGRPATSTGTEEIVLVPLTSCPASLSPQTQTAPSSVSAYAHEELASMVRASQRSRLSQVIQAWWSGDQNTASAP